MFIVLNGYTCLLLCLCCYDLFLVLPLINAESQPGGQQPMFLFFLWRKKKKGRLLWCILQEFILEKSAACPCVKPDIYAAIIKMLSEKMVSFLDTSFRVVGHDLMHYFDPFQWWLAVGRCTVTHQWVSALSCSLSLVLHPCHECPSLISPNSQIFWDLMSCENSFAFLCF